MIKLKRSQRKIKIMFFTESTYYINKAKSSQHKALTDKALTDNLLYIQYTLNSYSMSFECLYIIFRTPVQSIINRTYILIFNNLPIHLYIY